MRVAYLSIKALVQSGKLRPAALLATVALGLIANMLFVVTARTTLVTADAGGICAASSALPDGDALLCAAVLHMAAAWIASPNLRRAADIYFGLSVHPGAETIPRGWARGWVLAEIAGFSATPLIGHGSGAWGAFEQAPSARPASG